MHHAKNHRTVNNCMKIHEIWPRPLFLPIKSNDSQTFKAIFIFDNSVLVIIDQLGVIISMRCFKNNKHNWPMYFPDINFISCDFLVACLCVNMFFIKEHFTLRIFFVSKICHLDKSRCTLWSIDKNVVILSEHLLEFPLLREPYS